MKIIQNPYERTAEAFRDNEAMSRRICPPLCSDPNPSPLWGRTYQFLKKLSALCETFGNGGHVCSESLWKQKVYSY